MQSSQFNVRVPLAEVGGSDEVFLMNTFTDAQLVVSADGTHGFQMKKLGLNAHIPAGGRTVTVTLTPREVGTFEINCSEYCGNGHRRMKAWLIVRPGT